LAGSTQWAEHQDRLTEKVLRLGGLVEEAIGRATRALVQRDSDLARKVIDSDSEVDRLELEIDDLGTEMLGLYQPLAGDLRFVTMAMKITTDLERIGDLAVNVSERALELNEKPETRLLVDLPPMAGRAQEMVRSALDAFVRKDAAKARATIALDDDLDRRMEATFRELLTYMMEDPALIPRALRLSFVTKYFERMGDMATNICEQVVYMAEGTVIKHPALRRPPDGEEPR
jgi:phosphate transport system protein